jgi:hypothetical protein
MLRITLGIANTGSICTETTMCLLPAAFAIFGLDKDTDFDLSFPAGCYIQKNREECALASLEWNATHLMFIDSDMIFPIDGIVKLLMLDKDIAGGTYNKRTFPIEPILNKPKSELKPFPFAINALPTGFMLIKTEVFKKITPPWFACPPKEGTHEFIGEDVYFCRKANMAGCEIWLDPTIDIEHIGIYHY